MDGVFEIPRALAGEALEGSMRQSSLTQLATQFTGAEIGAGMSHRSYEILSSAGSWSNFLSWHLNQCHCLEPCPPCFLPEQPLLHKPD